MQTGYEKTILQILNGNIDLYTEIVAEYKNNIFAIVYSMLRDYHAAEDITQDVFIDGYIKLKSLSDYDKIGAWLAKIAKNKCYNYLTREALKYKRELELDDFIPDMRNYTPENYIIHKHEQDNLERAVKKLPDNQKTVTVLFYFENYSHKKIAEILNISENTVKQRLYNARLNLKKELDNMSENITNINNIDFEKEIAKKIKSLRNYYHLHNFTIDGIQSEVENFIKFIDSIPDSKLKHQAYITAYQWSDKEEYKTKVDKEIELAGGDPNAAQKYANEFYHQHASASWPKAEITWLNDIDGEGGIKKLEKMENSESCIGEMLFWRGRCNIVMGNYADARKDFERALEKIPRDSAYYPTAAAAIKAVDTLTTEHDKYLSGNLGVTGEVYRLYDNNKKLDFINQPGFGAEYKFAGKNRYNSFYYFSSGMKKNSNFFNLDMKESETTGEDTVISKNETVTVSAGTFENCIHIKSKASQERYWKDITTETWYAKDVGLIKCLITDDGKDDEIYELCEYKISGGDGYMPAFAGNIWKYKNINLADFYRQIIEYEIISVLDEPETESKYIYMAAFKLLRASYENCDSDIYLSLANNAMPVEDGWAPEPKKWDFDSAIKYLKLAIQKNSSFKASLFGVHALEYVKKFKAYRDKLWHLLPGGMSGSAVCRDKTNGKIIYKESDFMSMGPVTSWGPCFDETKCMGIKPFRYLQQLAGTLFDEKWTAGYTEQHKYAEGYTDITVKVEDGGTVKVKAGTFENCLKVTFNLEHIFEKAAYKHYYLSYTRFPHCGTKIYYFAPNVGIIKYDSIWGESQTAVCELTEYNSVATNGEYMPIYIGSKWIYDEMTLEPEYIARRKCDIVSGMEDEFFMIDEQEMLFQGNDEEYDEFKKKAGKLHYSDKEFHREVPPKNFYSF